MVGACPIGGCPGTVKVFGDTGLFTTLEGDSGLPVVGDSGLPEFGEKDRPGELALKITGGTGTPVVTVDVAIGEVDRTVVVWVCGPMGCPMGGPPTKPRLGITGGMGIGVVLGMEGIVKLSGIVAAGNTM